jgi:hypothetical protein
MRMLLSVSLGTLLLAAPGCGSTTTVEDPDGVIRSIEVVEDPGIVDGSAPNIARTEMGPSRCRSVAALPVARTAGW